MSRNIKTTVLLVLVIAVSVWKCGQGPTEPESGKALFELNVRFGRIPDPRFSLEQTPAEKDPLRKPVETGLVLQQIDLARIMVVDLSAYGSIEEVQQSEAGRAYTEDLENWEGDLQNWDERKLLIARHFRIITDQQLTISDGQATGQVTGVIGLNFFFLAFIEQNVIRYVGEGNAVGVEGETRGVDLVVEEIGDGAVNVAITAPANGSTLQTRTVTVTGTISDNTITQATLIVNQNPQTIAVDNGVFSNQVVLSNGTNTIRVQATNAEDQTGSAEITVFCQVATVDIRVTLTWNTSGTDLDLYVTDPNQETVYYSHRQSDIGGTLDVDDRNGYGPENFTLETGNAITGAYYIEVRYFGGTLPSTATVVVILHEGQANETVTTYGPHQFESGNTGPWQVATITWP